MTRIQRFYKNGGRAAWFQTLILVGVLFFTLRDGPGSGMWLVLPILAAAIGLGVFAEKWLVAKPERARVLMNAFALGAIVLMVASRISDPGGTLSLAGRLIILGLISLYLSAYFWLTSSSVGHRGR